MAATGQTLQVYNGDTLKAIFNIKMPDGTNPTFIAPTGAFAVTANYVSGPDYISKTGLAMTNVGGAWSLSVTLTPTDTAVATLPAGGQLYQARIADTDGSEITIAVGSITVFPIRPVV